MKNNATDPLRELRKVADGPAMLRASEKQAIREALQRHMEAAGGAPVAITFPDKPSPASPVPTP